MLFFVASRSPYITEIIIVNNQMRVEGRGIDWIVKYVRRTRIYLPARATRKIITSVFLHSVRGKKQPNLPLSVKNSDRAETPIGGTERFQWEEFLHTVDCLQLAEFLQRRRIFSIAVTETLFLIAEFSLGPQATKGYLSSNGIFFSV